MKIFGKHLNLLFKSPKERANALLSSVQCIVYDINQCTSVPVFVSKFSELSECINELIWLNERKGVYMYPTPRQEMTRIESNFSATISDLIERCISIIPTNDPGKYEQMRELAIQLDGLQSIGYGFTPQQFSRIQYLKDAERIDAHWIAEEKRKRSNRIAEQKRLESEIAFKEKRLSEQDKIRKERLSDLRRIEAENAEKENDIERVNHAVLSFDRVVSAIRSSHYSNRFFSNIYELQQIINSISKYEQDCANPRIQETVSKIRSSYEMDAKPYIESRIFQFIEEHISQKIYAGHINTGTLNQIVCEFERNDAFLSEKNKSVISQLRAIVDDSKAYDVEKINKLYIFSIDGIFDDMPGSQPHTFDEKDLEEIDKMDGLDFEKWCADLLMQNGFSNVTVTKASHDQGVDILACKDEIRYAIQCKCYSSDLDNTPVQEIVAGKEIYHCQIGAVMTNRKFTAGAIDAARSTGVLLWGRDKLLEMIKSATTESPVS